jgi:large subunit ribosomal protein L1
MIKHGKKYKKSLETLEVMKLHDLREGVTKVKDLGYARFNESISVNVILGIDAEKSDQSVRGSLILPNSFREAVRVLVFAKGDQAEAAKKAGADFVGAEDLIEKISNGWFDFDYAIATPDLMGLVGKVARSLGPKGLLPNKKNGTVALEVSPVIKELKSGLSFFKNDKNGQVNYTFGKKSLSVEQLVENLELFFKTLRGLRPSSAKGIFIKKATISSTMGPGVKLEVGFLAK